MIRPSRTAIGLLGWVVAAAAAVTAGIFAVGAIGSGISGSTTSPLSNQAVAKALAQTTARSPSPEPPATRATTSPRGSEPEPGRSPTDPTGSRGSSDRSEPPSRSRAGNTRVLNVRGGSIVASCDNGLATLQSWTPEQGYEADGIHRGPESVARIEFKSDAAETKVGVACRGGIPVAHQRLDDDD